MPYHFPVLSGPPFFVKGIIARGMRRSYEGKVPLDQGGVLFVDDLDEFAAAAQLELDGSPTIVITSADADPLIVFKGEVSSRGVDEVVAVIDNLLPADRRMRETVWRRNCSTPGGRSQRSRVIPLRSIPRPLIRT